jgi:hypothetical protein
MDLILNNTQVKELFSVPQATLSRWRAEGFPMLERNKYPLKECFDWYVTHKIAGGGENDDTASELKRKFLFEQTRLKRAQAELAEIQTKKAKEQLIDTAEIYKMWISRYLEFQAGFWIRAIRLAPLLEGKNRHEIEEIISRYDIELMTHFKRAGSFTKGGNWTEEEKKAIFKYLDEMKKEFI